MSILVVPSFEDLVADYQNTAAHNDRLFWRLSELTWADPDLSAHRRHIEQNELGFGHAVFHAMWLRLLDNAKRRFGTVQALEIGVYKGQVISLWAVIGRAWNIDIRISAITPLSGQPMPRSRFVTWLRKHLDPNFREQLRNANFYAQADYLTLIRQLFDQFEVNFEDVCRNLAIELHGNDCGRIIFFAAMSAYDYDRSERDDVTICRNIRRKHIRTSIVASTAVSTAGSVTRGSE